MRWTRRRVCGVMAGSAVLLLPRAVWAKDPPRSEVYAKDVEFLLGELFKKASGLLRQKGVDWKAVEAEFRKAVKGVKSDGEHLLLCSRLVARLRDGHAGLRDVKAEWPDESKGRRWSGPNVHLAVSGKDVLVKHAEGQAVAAGVTAGTVLKEIDDRPARAWLDAKMKEMRDERGYSTDHQVLYAACHWGLGDWEGTYVEFAFPKGKGVEKAKIERRGGNNSIPDGPAFPPPGLATVGRQSFGRTAAGNGYLHLRDVPGELPSQVDRALAAIGGVPGLVLDLRANGGGGTDHDAVLARFVAKDQQFNGVKSAGDAPYGGPMVVIVDAGVRSAGETIAGMFQDPGRAYVIGESPTAGMSSQKTTVTVPSGLFSVLFSTGSHGNAYNGGRGIEGFGIPPHETVPYAAADLARGVDTQIRRAEELLAKPLPREVVKYPP